MLIYFLTDENMRQIYLFHVSFVKEYSEFPVVTHPNHVFEMEFAGLFTL